MIAVLSSRRGKKKREKLTDEIKEVLGKVGNSGNTEGPHIHFQVQQGPDFNTSKGIKITFKNTYTNNKKVKYIEKNMYVYTK